MFKNLTPAEYEVLLRHDFATFAMRIDRKSVV